PRRPPRTAPRGPPRRAHSRHPAPWPRRGPGASPRARCYPEPGVTCFDDETVLGLLEGRRGAGTEMEVLEAHLDDCEACRALVTVLACNQETEHVLARGHTLGRFVIGDLLGTGAMGRVYSAWEP